MGRIAIAETEFVKALRSFGVNPEDGLVIVGHNSWLDVYVDGTRLSKGLEEISVSKSVKRSSDWRLNISGEIRFNEDGTPKFENEDADEKLLSVLSRYFGYRLIKGEALEADR